MASRLFFSLLFGASLLTAQDQWPTNKIPSLQLHGFLSQGYALTDQNNYLTMRTDGSGTGKFTDGGLNLTWRVPGNEKLRFGVQAYDRYIGDLGKGRVSLDWALVDYHFRDWLGIRAGKVKTPLGLFNDSQDQEFLYTWALLPQSVYPLDLRETNNAHVGGDLYGSIDLHRKGSLSYQLYAGTIPSDYRTGFLYGLEDAGYRNLHYETRTTGGDLRWTTPLPGLMLGTSHALQLGDYDGDLTLFGYDFHGHANMYHNHQTAWYLEYTHGPWRFDGEFRSYKSLTRIVVPGAIADTNITHSQAWFAALSYRINRHVEIGGYRAQYRLGMIFAPVYNSGGPGANFIADTTTTLRVDPKPYWSIKLEGHFMNGVGNPLASRGFYPRYHPQGVAPTTNMLVLRTGVTF